jgi:MFS family permease
MVVGRFLQGIGGGGLVPATLALVAEIWPAERRGLPLGVVGAVQELGSVVGPLYGALVLAASGWQTIFWINLAVALVLVAAVLAVRAEAGAAAARDPRRPLPDLLGGGVGLAAVVALGLLLVQPQRLTRGLTTGLAFVPYVGTSRWTTPVAIAFYLLALAFAVRELTARRPLVDVRELWEMRHVADYGGAALLGLALAGIVLAFATSDPAVQVFSRIGPIALTGSAVATALFIWRQRHAAAPLVPRGALGHRAAWGAILVSFFVGSSLIAALVDIPVFARLTIYQNSQLGAALVLVRLLAALPVGAVLGGYLTRFVPIHLLVLGGMLLASAAFLSMTRWDHHAVLTWSASSALVAGGLGFGIAIAPVSSALLAATDDIVHGVSSALLVVARMVGMLVGLSALTTISLRRFYAVKSGLPTLRQVCGSDTLCTRYTAVLERAGIAQLHTIFAGAAFAAVVAAVLGVVLLRTQARDA